MATARTSDGRNAEGAKDVAAKERTATTDAAIHDDVLEELQLVTVEWHITRTVFYVAGDNAHVAPAVIPTRLLGAEVAHHLTAPGAKLVGLFAVDDEAQLPGVEAFEGWVEFTRQEGFFVSEVARHGVYEFGCRSVRLGGALLVGHRMLKCTGECEFV